MKTYIVEMIKDVILSILIIACIVLIFSVFFYDKISLSKVIPESQDYELSREMKQELEDTELEDAEEVIINYYIDAADLKKYEKNNQYVKGKSNPFSEGSGSVPDDNNVTDGNNTTTGNNYNTSGNFYDDDGTK